MTDRTRSNRPHSRPQTTPVLFWFRDDLRIADNVGLTRAAETGGGMVALYVWDEESPGLRVPGAAARWWLASALRALHRDLAAFGVPLILRRGPAIRVVSDVAGALGAETVAWNPSTCPVQGRIDHALAEHLANEERRVIVGDAPLLHPLGAIRTASGATPRTFAAFFRAARAAPAIPPPLPRPERLAGAPCPPESERLEDWGFEPTRPDWAQGLRQTWSIGESAAHLRLSAFIAHGLKGYADKRDFPALPHASRLSPHLRFGEVSPRQVVHAVRHAAAIGTVPARDAEKFESELYWREYAHHLRHEMPDMALRNIQGAFDALPWREAPGELKAWRRGLTGYPMVDAGMRELWRTGHMHNRARMVVASFLAKHLLMDWREGERWFWDTLLDADCASNPFNWQWVAGTGLDAAPYFRIFNPVMQGEKFDPKGEYVRAHVPELSKLPNTLIHKPWTADEDTLRAAGIRLGVTYPKPLVDHAAARERALLAFEHLKGRAHGAA